MLNFIIVYYKNLYYLQKFVNIVKQDVIKFYITLKNINILNFIFFSVTFVFFPFIYMFLFIYFFFKFFLNYSFLFLDFLFLDFLLKNTYFLKNLYFNLRELFYICIYRLFFEFLVKFIKIKIIDKFSLIYWFRKLIIKTQNLLIFIINLLTKSITIIKYYSNRFYKLFVIFLPIYYRMYYPIIRKKIKYIYNIIFYFILFYKYYIIWYIWSLRKVKQYNKTIKYYINKKKFNNISHILQYNNILLKKIYYLFIYKYSILLKKKFI